MNQSNVDYLYQIFAPAADRTLSVHRDDIAVGFGVHLNQASTSISEPIRTPQQAVHPSVAAPHDDNDKPKAHDRPSETPQTLSTSDSRPQTDSASGANTPTCEPCDKKRPASAQANESNDDEGDSDQKSETASAVAGATSIHSGQQPAHKKQAAANKTSAGANDRVAVEVTTEAQKATVDRAAHVDAVNESTLTLPTVPESVDEPTRQPAEDGAPAKRSVAPRKPVGKVANRSVNAESANDPPANSSNTTSTLESELDEEHPAAERTFSAAGAKRGETARRTRTVEGAADGDTAAKGDKSGDEPAAPRAPANSSTNSAIAAVANHLIVGHVDANSTAEKASADREISAKPADGKTEGGMGPLGRTLRSAVEMNRGHKTTEDTPHVDPARFVSRVARAIHTANERGGTLQLRLAPPELGSLRIELSVKDGVMSAALEADSAAARKLLLDHLPVLRDRLAEQNIRVERFDVDVRPDNSGTQTNSRGSNHNPYQQQFDRPEPRRTSPSLRNIHEVAHVEAPSNAARISSTEINLVI